MNLSPKSQTARLSTESILLKSSETLHMLYKDFQTFVDEISEWGVDHIGGLTMVSDLNSMRS